MHKTYILSNAGIFAFFILMLVGSFIMSSDVIVLLHGITAEATVMTPVIVRGHNCNRLPTLRYMDSASHSHLITLYDTFGCPSRLRAGQSIEILYVPNNPSRILLAQDSFPLTISLSIFGVGIGFILALIALICVGAFITKSSLGTFLYTHYLDQ